MNRKTDLTTVVQLKTMENTFSKIAEIDQEHRKRVAEEFNKFCKKRLRCMDPKEAVNILQSQLNCDKAEDPKRTKTGSNNIEEGPSTSTQFQNEQAF